jgi:hypothetical protein
MNKIENFEREQQKIRELDFAGNAVDSDAMYRQYQRRNSFGLAPRTEIHRIFQRDFYEKDVADGYLTLPLATATVWADPLENPLANVQDADSVTGSQIQLGSLVSSFYALCWTNRTTLQPSDWASFSHGREAVRISTTVTKLMDRMMHVDHSCYMHRSWLVNVEYKDPALIQAMKNPDEAYRRMESTGSLLAVSAALVRTQFSHEDEVRLLFDASIQPPLPDVIYLNNNSLVQIPFDWTGFVNKQVFN